MVEILDVGTDAQTCFMAGRGMNGLRGTIVCYNASNQRYTLELDSGDMLSLRARNVEAYCVEEEDSEPEDGKVEEVEVASFKHEVDVPVKQEKVKRSASATSTVKKEPSTTTKKKQTPGALPKYPDKIAEDESNKPEKNCNIVDQFIYAIAGALHDVSPSVILLSIFAAYYANKFFNGGSSSTENDATKDKGTMHGPYNRHAYYHPDDIYYDHYDPYYAGPRHWWYGWGGRWNWHGWYYWGWYGASGICSVAVVGFFIWQFGTRKGLSAFSWHNVKTHVQGFSYWDVMMYASLLERAIYYLTRMAQSGGQGGGRRR